MQVVRMFPYTEHRLRINENDLQMLINDEDADDDDESLDVEEGDSNSNSSKKCKSKRQARIHIRSSKQSVVCQTLLRSRLAWLIIILSIVLIILCYENYIENMRQLRIQDYIKQTDDLENKLKGMDIQLASARSKLQELMQSKMKEKSL